MADLHTEDFPGELVARGLIAPVPPPRLLSPNNVDRRTDDFRASWVARLPDGRAAKVTLGARVEELAGRQSAFAQACPGLVAAPLFVERLAQGQALVEEFFEGFTLESAVQEKRMSREEILAAFERICAALAATEAPSTEAARQAEWQAWSDRLCGQRFWQNAEAQLLRISVLPLLYPLVAADLAVTRWTNGDFLSTNILLDPAGGARLIDTEFAARTHFFTEDAVRFNALSPAAAVDPELFAGDTGEPGLAWHLFFWLRQLQLEAESNTPDYLSRHLPLRLGVIRRLVEYLLPVPLDGWSVPSLEVRHGLEEARWQPVNSSTIRLAGWCHVPAATELRGVMAFCQNRPVARTNPIGRRDVQQYFSGDSRALLSGFALATAPVRADARLTLCVEIDQGALLPFHTLAAQDLPKGAPPWDDYAAWADENDPDPPGPPTGQEPTGPIFSILLPVYNPPLPYLQACIGSVLAQHYPHWELCIVDDASTRAGVADCLRQFAGADPRIHVRTRAENGGISRASNEALAAATGGFVVLLDHDDLLRPHALFEFARRLEREPELDAVYSDEDKITAEGRRVIPFLKPDFSPEFLLRVMYVGHALCVRTAVARAAGAFDPAFDGVQDYEFFLRVTGHARNIGHVARMLYHWRQSPGSSALHGNVKGDMDEKQAAAVRAHLQRHGRKEHVAARGGHRVELLATRVPSTEIVRPTANEDELAALRRAVEPSQADVIVLLMVEPQRTTEHWLRNLAALAHRPDSGCVAPVLLSREGRVLEAGWTIGPAGATPLMRGFDRNGDGYNGTLRCSREVAAVSPLCVALRRDLLIAALPGAPPGERWLDFCLRLQDHGVFNRVCAVSRLRVDRSWRDAPTLPAPRPGGDADRFFNRHFESRNPDYRLRDDLVSRVPRWYLDTALPETSVRGCLLVRGWCFGPRATPIRAVRLRAGDLTISGVVGLPRPDVRVALPEAPDDNTGFEIRGTLPAGRQKLVLEAQTADGRWHVLMTQTVRVKRRLVPLWLGGGAWTELMFFQMPAHMAHPARPVRPEKFPAPRGDPARRPRFSIVTPSFQQARFLGETMRSVLDQTGVECEYVVQDGGSTDGSLELIRRMVALESDSQPSTAKVERGLRTRYERVQRPRSTSVRPRLTAWASEPDSGQADAIARGFAKTAGSPDDVMAWLNSDDFYLPGALAFVADYFVRHPDVDMLYGHRIVVNEESQEIARWFLPAHDETVLRLNDFIPQETVFWRRRVWDKVGGLDASYKFAMDWDLYLRFQATGARIVRVPFFLGCFRVHPGQKTSAAMHDVGQREIGLLRARANGREIPAADLEQDSRLLRYLRHSAFLEFLWKLGVRSP